MRFSTEWIDQGPNASAEERATLCRLSLYVSEENACRFFDPTSNRTCDHVTVPAVHLAEGLATDWWSIFGGRDREHAIRKYRTGFALPDVTLGFDGLTFEIRGEQFAFTNPDVRFWQVGREGLPRDAAESILAGFIEDVAARLATAGLSDSEVALRWSRLSRSLGDPEERAFCEAAGALGVDPYAISEADATFIEQAAELFSGEALLELLAGLGNTARGDLLDWVRRTEARPREQACLPELNDVADRVVGGTWRPVERGWATGYRAASAFRDVLNIPRTERLSSPADIARRLGSGSFVCTAGVAGVSALVSRGDDDVRIHVRERGPWDWARYAENFAFARAIGDAVCYRDTQRSVVNNLRQAERQAVGRAFAAEFLAPVKSVLQMVRGGCDIDEISGSFNVSPQVIDWQIENQDRIRDACDRGHRRLARSGDDRYVRRTAREHAQGNGSVTFRDEQTMLRAIRNLEARRSGLARYDLLQRSLLKDDVTSNRDFQRAFKSFYRVRRGEDWCKVFFCILEREKRNDGLSFREVVEDIHRETGRVEASFSSKLVATIDKGLPVWDKHVLDNLGLRPPYSGMDPRRRLDRCVELYSRIQSWASNEIRQSGFAEWQRRFDRAFPSFRHFTDVKKLDLFLWQSR